MAGSVPDVTGDKGGFVDPADFIFSNKSYHDCNLIVTDPDSKKVETIPVRSYLLIFQSSVFRKILPTINDVLGGERKSVEINNVSPAITKLMLRYIYGGKLPPMDLPTRAQLALAARAYDLQYLEQKCCKKLVPTTVDDDVFPALVCVAHLENANLLPHVTKIVQEKTEELIQLGAFMKLDAKCMGFIAWQDKLAIKEVELWKALVKWATACAGKDAKKTVRDFLSSTLPFVRFLTMTQDQIIKEVMPCKILTDTEVVSLMTAVSSGTTFDCHGLCKNAEVRSMPEKKLPPVQVPVPAPVVKVQPPPKNTIIIHFNNNTYSFKTQASKNFSCIKIQPYKPFELQSLTVMSLGLPTNTDSSSYAIKYNIVVYEMNDGNVIRTLFIKSNITMTAIFGEEIAIPLVDQCGIGLLLSKTCAYIAELYFIAPHPVFSLHYNYCDIASKSVSYGNCHITFKSKAQSHVRKITCKM